MNIKRTPILNKRESIRYPVKISNSRSSLCSINIGNKNKKSLFETQDCAGNKFIYVNKLTNVSKRLIEKYLDTAETSPYIYLNVNYINNIEFIDWIVEKVSIKNIPVYIETDRDLPEGIINNLSKNAFNILQCNLSQLSDEKEDYSSEEEYKRISILRTLPYKAKVQGLYVVLSIDPIIPQLTQLKHILTMITAEKNVYDHITLNFIKINRILNARDYVTYGQYSKNPIRLDADYFELNDNNVWECAKWYKDLVVENIKYLAKDSKITVCGESKNCRGLILKTSTKSETGAFKVGGNNEYRK